MAAIEPRTVKLPGAGLSLAADLYGDETDPPVVLLHGGGQTRHAWGGAAAAFAESGRFAISIDLRGHGHSDWSPDGMYGMTQFAADVHALAASLGRSPVLVGASLGGLASLVAVGEATTPVATALVLVDVAPRIEVEGRVKIQSFMRAGMRGFDTLEEVADSVSEFIPSRPRPDDPREESAPARRRSLVLALGSALARQQRGHRRSERPGPPRPDVCGGQAGHGADDAHSRPHERHRER